MRHAVPSSFHRSARSLVVHGPYETTAPPARRHWLSPAFSNSLLEPGPLTFDHTCADPPSQLRATICPPGSADRHRPLCSLTSSKPAERIPLSDREYCQPCDLSAAQACCTGVEPLPGFARQVPVCEFWRRWNVPGREIMEPDPVEEPAVGCGAALAVAPGRDAGAALRLAVDVACAVALAEARVGTPSAETVTNGCRAESTLREPVEENGEVRTTQVAMPSSASAATMRAGFLARRTLLSS